MGYLIDSDWVIDHLAEVEAAVDLLSELAGEGIAISVVTYLEVYQGILRSPSLEQAQVQFEAFLEGVPTLPLSLAVARRCAQLRETLRQQGKRVHPRALDLIIAATALEYDLTLVTRNRTDYADVPGLKIYTLE
jgi:tRNA(fMet)-specific endonuclease VapC